MARKNLDDPKVVVVEVSTEPGVYERGHIRNAVKITWHTDLVDTVNRDVVSAANFQKFAQAAGINQDSTVVLYGDKNNWFAAWGRGSLTSTVQRMSVFLMADV